MRPENFLKYFYGHNYLASLTGILNGTLGEKIHLKGLVGSAKSIFTAILFKEAKCPLLILTDNREDAAYFYDDLFNLGLKEATLFFPSSYKRSIQYGRPERDNIVQRTETLSKINEKNSPKIVVTYPEALIEKVISQDDLEKSILTVGVGDKISLGFITEFLNEFGFERTDFVYSPGQFAVRGSIVDIFSYSSDIPLRLDFFGDIIESIRKFDIDTQISNESLQRTVIVPDTQTDATKIERIPLPAFMPEHTVCLGNDLNRLIGAIIPEEREVSAPDFLASGDELKNELKRMTVFDWGSDLLFEPVKVIQFLNSRQPVFHKKFDFLSKNLEEYQNAGYQLFLLSNQEKQIERLKAIFNDIKADIRFIPVNFTLNEGFVENSLKICCYTDHQIFERYHRYKLQAYNTKRETVSLSELNKLHPGDYVVHIDHGIGKFAGLVRTEINGKMQEAIRLVYKNNDSLLVNIHSLHRITKYKGREGSEPSLNQLGTGAWQRMKNRTKAKVKDIAKELISLYAQRMAENGFAFSPDTYLQNELEASFIYEDTPDQEKATAAVKEDMEKPVPMDRLVCGDVGFGKTEVAIRAAFKAAVDNKQVALLVPTTILALQHYKTFSERLKDFPVNISYISRFKSAAGIRETLNELAEGKIDILIGTHRLVSKDVKFKDLGLLIVDEEQKFGVAVKEKLKHLKVNVDTLSLTATPIPRTLQFSLMGARDLSIIQTPPPNRYPIITEVHGFNDQLIRDAVLYELGRNGQVFFIHNRIENIYEVRDTIHRIVPEASLAVGHGQMEGHKLEKTMLDYINGKYDILIATTIIESGLDIPNANTMIINQAQKYGLSDLHQLRGRVGRSNKKAFCYLITPPLSTLNSDARRRLKAIEEFSELGSGFNIAMQDLDIRGAGNLLGAEQSGFIADIGFETYHRILDEAVQELKQEEFKDLFKDEEKKEAGAFLNINFTGDCHIDTDMELLMPESYVPGSSERMALYRELDNVENREQLEKFKRGLEDRFGKLPDETRELLEIVRLRWIAIGLGMEKIFLKEGKMICHFISDQKSPFYRSQLFMNIVNHIQKGKTRGRMQEKNHKLTFTVQNVINVETARFILEEMTAETM